MSKGIRNMVLIIMMAAASFIAAASSFSNMSAEELIMLLNSSRTATTGAATLSAKKSVSDVPKAIEVDARDMITKVFGVAGNATTRRDCMDATRNAISITPNDEDGNLWLDSDNGYRLSYSGMTPDVSAIARFNATDSIDEFCYFFLFPYNTGNKPDINRAQSDFAGTLLQELNDITDDIGADSLTPNLFDVNGRYAGNMIDVRLVDDSRRYILMFIIQPSAYTSADDIAAL